MLESSGYIWSPNWGTRHILFTWRTQDTSCSPGVPVTGFPPGSKALAGACVHVCTDAYTHCSRHVTNIASEVDSKICLWMCSEVHASLETFALKGYYPFPDGSTPQHNTLGNKCTSPQQRAWGGHCALDGEKGDTDQSRDLCSCCTVLLKAGSLG